MIILAGCEYDYKFYHEHIRKNTEVTSLEFIRYENPDALTNLKTDYKIDLSKLTYIQVLQGNLTNFSIDIKKIGGLSNKLDDVLKSPHGVGILLPYKDKGYTLITVSKLDVVDVIFIGHYDEDNNLEYRNGNQ